MSTDKTLADVQPGGRVRLGDALPPLPCTGYSAYSDGTEPLYTAEQMQNYARAALSALPSPGGQGDVPECAKRAMYDEVWNALHAAGFGDDLASSIAVLAARQPVGEPVGAAKPGKRVGMLEAVCGPERHFDPAAADAELASIPLVPLWKLPELHPRKVVYECLSTMEYVRQGTKQHSSRRHVLTEAIALAKRFIEKMEAIERGGK
ncbi:hypothetical protein [Stenotrophomonas hibiscicola]|uniref:hypothetical protein n=1 Tax=Stenotrophomonas hibiscicola TaxID=86189 RepID=UPI00035C814E|nr:hypothetical protein [[Pseudomonas] hibiscicola]